MRKSDKLITLTAILFAVFLFFPVCSASASNGVKRKLVRVACVGNSITYGTGIADRDKDSYPAQLQKLLGDKYVVGNFGKPGATLLRHGHRPYFDQKEYRDALGFKGDIAVIHLGINDTDPRNWPNYRDDFVADYLALIDSLRTANPSVRVIIARLTPIADRHPRFVSGTKLWHDEIQEAIETVARVSGAELIDFESPLYPYPNLLPDAIHPNEEGAAMLARVVYGGITGDYGGLRLSPLYTDNMVLQRGIPLDIHGIANSGTLVRVGIGGPKVEARANNRGEWTAVLQPMPAARNLTLTVEAGREKRVFRNVAVGEVWLCSGQSNMAFTLSQAATASADIPNATDSDLRLYDMKPNWQTYDVEWSHSAIDSINHLRYFADASWCAATPETVRDFSAVAYYFGRMLRDSLDVPVGLVCNAVGGAPAEAWIDRNTLETQFPDILRDWLHNDFIQDWVRGRAAKNIGKGANSLSRHPYQPCYLYESGILPLQRYGIRGVAWYQGESNAHNMEAHEKLFKLLVESWRSNWRNAAMPFYFVQLSSLNRPSWTWFRDSQLRLMRQISATGMAVSSDVGDSLDVHPTRKLEVGYRLARWALAKTYGKSIVPSGPLAATAWREGSEAVVRFDYATGLSTSDGKPVSCFEIAENDGMFYPATAVISGDCVRLSSPSVTTPHYVRYAWQPFTRANLVNAAMLPASTFRIVF